MTEEISQSWSSHLMMRHHTPKQKQFSWQMPRSPLSQKPLDKGWGHNLCGLRRHAHSPIGVSFYVNVNILRGLPCCVDSSHLKFIHQPSISEGGDLAELKKRSGSAWLGAIRSGPDRFSTAISCFAFDQKKSFIIPLHRNQVTLLFHKP